MYGAFWRMIALLLSEGNFVTFIVHANKLYFESFKHFFTPFGYKINFNIDEASLTLTSKQRTPMNM